MDISAFREILQKWRHLMVILNFLLRMVECNQVIHCEKFPLEMLKSIQEKKDKNYLESL